MGCEHIDHPKNIIVSSLTLISSLTILILKLFGPIGNFHYMMQLVVFTYDIHTIMFFYKIGHLYTIMFFYVNRGESVYVSEIAIRLTHFSMVKWDLIDGIKMDDHIQFKLWTGKMVHDGSDARISLRFIHDIFFEKMIVQFQ